jgi:hypothetical protein
MCACNAFADVYEAVKSLGMRYTIVIDFKMGRNREKIRK